MRKIYNKFIARIVIDGLGVISEAGHWLYENAGAARTAAHKLFWTPVE